MRVATNGGFLRKAMAWALPACAVVLCCSGCRSLSFFRPKPSRPLLGSRTLIPPPYSAPVSVAPAPEPLVTPLAVESITDRLPTPTPAPVDEVETVSAAPGIVMPPPVKSADLTYTVVKGDSFWDIARMYGVTHQALAAHNSMGEDDVLAIGKVLRIPPGGRYIPPEGRPPVKPPAPKKGSTGKKSPTASASRSTERVKRPADGKYIVKSGDSLWVIARRFGCTTAALKEVNNLSRDLLQIGQVLQIPKAGTASSKVTTPDKAGATSGKTTKGPAPTQKDTVKTPLTGTKVEVQPIRIKPREIRTLEHTVLADETLEIIAAMYESDVPGIKKANPGIKSSADLKPGMKIKVPYREE